MFNEKIGKEQRLFGVMLGYPFKDDVQISHTGLFYACDDRGWGLQLNFTEDKDPERYKKIKGILDSIISEIKEIEKLNITEVNNVGSMLELRKRRRS